MENLVITLLHPLIQNIVHAKIPVEKFTIRNIFDKRLIFPKIFGQKDSLNNYFAQRDIQTLEYINKWKEEFNCSEIKSYNFYNDRLNKSIETITNLKNDVSLEIAKNTYPDPFMNPSPKAQLDLWKYNSYLHIEEELQNFTPTWMEEVLKIDKSTKYQDCIDLFNKDPETFKEVVIAKIDDNHPINGNQTMKILHEFELIDVIMKSKYINQNKKKFALLLSELSGKTNSWKSYTNGYDRRATQKLDLRYQNFVENFKNS